MVWPQRWLNRGTPPKKALAEDMKVCCEVANKSSRVTLVRTGQDGEVAE